MNENDFLEEEEKILELQLRQLNRDINDESKLSYRSLQSISQNPVNLDEIIQIER